MRAGPLSHFSVLPSMSVNWNVGAGSDDKLSIKCVAFISRYEAKRLNFPTGG